MQVLCVITFGAVFAARGEISLGTFIAFISYNGMLVWPIRNLGRILSEMSKSGVSFARIGEILGAKEEDRGGTALPALSGDVQFSHVSFSYDGAAVLDDVSFTAKAGKTLAILGSTGSGKSTVVQLLTRLYELPAGCGEITVDGVDVRTVPVEHLRSKNRACEPGTVPVFAHHWRKYRNHAPGRVHGRNPGCGAHRAY